LFICCCSSAVVHLLLLLPTPQFLLHLLPTSRRTPHQHFHVQRLAVFLRVVIEELLAQLCTPEVAQQVLQDSVIFARPTAALMLLACRKQVQGWLHPACNVGMLIMHGMCF
jgi:hypothetical protein